MRLLFILVIFILSVEAKSLFSNSDQADNAKYINSLKDLVVATQKTRGLTNGYLNGNTSALLLIHGNQRDMKKAIGIMESLPLSSKTTINDRATKISQALIKLNNRALKISPEIAFSEYTEQIDQTLMLAQTISKQGSKDLNPFAQDASVIMMEIILPLMEQVGQMRGMGSGVIAKGRITETQKFAMISMLSQINDLESQLQKTMKMMVLNNNKKYDSTIEMNLSAVNKALANYKALTKMKVLKESSGLDTDDYFTQGTDIISILINIFNSNNKAIMKDSKGWL